MMKELTYKFAANPAEMDEIRQVWRKVFVAEQGIDEALTFAGAEDGQALHAAVRDGAAVIGTARVVFPAAATAKIERMAVLADYRRRGVGRGIIAFLSGELAHRGIKRVYLHAQYAATGFYRDCGFRETGRPFYEAGIRHVRMEMTL